MPNTYYQNYAHTVFPVKYRKAVIHPDWQSKLFGVMGNLINETSSKTVIVNGVEDHVHCLFGFRPAVSISEVMKSVKARSSKWINDNNLLTHRFEWQKGFGCFTCGYSQLDRIYKYILNQEEHHKKMTFREEYLMFLKKFEIDYDERYIFHDLI